MTSAFRANSRQTREFIVDCMKAGLVANVQSSPGMGKSAIVASIADEYKLALIDHRLSTSAPEDLSGLPNFSNGKATFSPFDLFPTTTTPLPAGKQGWLLFLDEFNSASKAVQAAAYKLILDRMVGQHHLHPNVVIVCAGNLSTDRAITNPLSTAMQSRVVHIEMEMNHEIFMQDVALKMKWDSRIVAFLSFKPSALHDFRPDHNDKTFCCPRTWSFMNALIQGKEVQESKAPLYAGTITSGTAVEFIQFTKVYASLPKLSEVLSDPAGCRIPGDPAVRYAMTTFLMEHSSEDNFEKITEYVNRFTSEFRVLFFRGLMIQQPALRRHAAFRAAMLELSRYLHD